LALGLVGWSIEISFTGAQADEAEERSANQQRQHENEN
jgi:hypothetical protein